MPNYNFSDIFYGAEYAFQQFACAMVSKRENVIFQRFGMGRDGGIDGLYEDGERRIVLQAKRTSEDWKKVYRDLKKESEKAQDISCDRYILVLSVRNIGVENKEKIKKLFPKIQSTQDIITGQDLNGYLENAEYWEIAKEYLVLLAQSGNQMEEMIREIVVSVASDGWDTAAKIQNVKMLEEVKTFVTTARVQEAIEILEEYHWVVISGDPGAGKTAHALYIAYQYISKNESAKLYSVQGIKELEDVVGKNENQGEEKVIIYDDFWGHNIFSEKRQEIREDRRLQDIFYIIRRYNKKMRQY